MQLSVHNCFKMGKGQDKTKKEAAVIEITQDSNVVGASAEKTDLIASEQNKRHGMDLVFKDVSVHINGKKILDNISGMVKQGDMLAVMGPSGAGKSTLLNAILKRLPRSGHVTVNNEIFSKQHVRQVAYCTQDDIFFPNLTLRETLYYTAELRLPETLHSDEKEARISDVVKVLDLDSCLDTPMGGLFSPGLSGGQRRRSSIACELLTDPQLMFLDEPTSGLDSAIAYSLMATLKRYTVTSNKTIVASIHQPSSQMFYLFKWLLLIADGQMVYFGKVDNLVQHLESIGIYCHLHFNPADFILEKLKEEQSKTRMMSQEAIHLQSIDWPAEIGGETDTHRVRGDRKDFDIVEFIEEGNAIVPVFSGGNVNNLKFQESRWPTKFKKQYLTLTKRHFRLNRDHMLSKYWLIKLMTITLTTCLVWWQLERTEETITDRLGLTFFPVVVFMFEVMIETIASFPAEQGVIMKERASGIYRISAYYFAKMTSELPLLFITPAVFVTLTYWLCALTSSAVNFFAFLIAMWLQCLVSQSMGLAVILAFGDMRRALTMAIVITIPTMLTGGFLTRNLPYWLSWIQYLSFTQYAFRLMNQIEFEYGDFIRCAPANLTVFEDCRLHNVTHIPRHLVLTGIQSPLPLWANVVILLSFLFVLRVAGYLALKYLRQPIRK